MRGFVPQLRTLLVSTSLLMAAALPSAQTLKGQHRQPSAPPGPVVLANQRPLRVSPTAVDFGPVPSGQQQSIVLTLRNTGNETIDLKMVRFVLGESGNSAAFRVLMNGKTYLGSTADVVRSIQPPLALGPGAEVQATLFFQPTEAQLDTFLLGFENFAYVARVTVRGLGGHSDPFLHVTVEGPRWRVDYDEDGSEAVFLDGTGSHTHEPGHSLSAYEWRVDGQVLSTTTTLSTVLSAPETEIELAIFDDNVPPHTLALRHDVRVVAPDEVPGVLAYYYDASGSGAEALLDDVPASADYLEQRPDMKVVGVGQVGGSPFSSNVLVRLVGELSVDTPGVYTLAASGGAARRLLLDGAPVTGPVSLDGASHSLEARFAVDTLSNLPLDVTLSQGGPGVSLSEDLLTHDETEVVPVIHAMTPSGLLDGGDPITIEGFGFFPPQQVVVHWGDIDLVAADFTSIDPTHIHFLSPPGGGSIAVSVENQNGESNVRTFLYELEGPPPILFRRDLTLIVPSPTAGVWGPDGELYVSSLDGRITVLQFDEHYEIVSQTVHAGVSGLSNRETVSLAINPYDPPSPVKLYVGHGDLFVNGGVPPTGPSPYTGQISVLTGPSFSSPTALITGLPVSNHDHGINGIVFDNNGDLLISVGSMTNAGVKAPNSGDLPESPFSTAVLKAHLSKPGFNGAISYVETLSGLPNDDQRDGEIVDVVPGVDIEVHAAGLRNAYGIVYTTQGRLYAADNGPNIGFGAASTGPETQTSDPYDDDELDLVEWGNYYGSPNRNRGRTDARQNVYYAGLQGPPSIPDTLFQMIGWLPSSSNGIDEYRANTFQGQMRGDLVVQRYQNKMRRVSMKPDGRGTLGQLPFDPTTAALACLTGPGGAIVALDVNNNELEVLEPDDLTPLELVVHDIFPWRAPAAGGTQFVIGGRGFGTLATTTVTIGGLPAELVDVSWGRIHGVIPAQASPTTGLLDVVVEVSGNASTLTAAFRYLLGAGAEPGRWQALTNLGSALGEVAAGVIGSTMYLVGEGGTATLAYDVQNRQWLSSKATRPFLGHHHGAEVVSGKLYLVGGLDGGSEGQVQIYDPGSNSWTQGAAMPWSAGSLCTAVIAGKIYAAGGITTGGFTVGNCAVYDPTTDIWTSLAPMPDSGRNHAATATDGSRLFVFGGRRGGNFVTNGYDSLMIYDPQSDSWTWNGDVGSTLAPLPEARGGMGKAIYLRGEFYVFGGETLDDPDANANGVYARVDVYDPLANTWRSEAAMPNPRHGIFPVLYQGHVFLAGGGTHSANSQSTLFDTFTRQ